VSAEIRQLTLPLSEHEARGLRLGEMVSLNGLLFTGRSLFHIRAAERGIVPPIDFKSVNAFFHVGPVMRRVETPSEADHWEVVSCEPTSSLRFERYGPFVVRQLGLRTLIGKTTMGPATGAALAEVGGVHLTKVGLCGNALARAVVKVHGVYFMEELGKTEATWVYEVRDFGPFFVDIDASGANYFQQLSAEIAGRSEAIARQLGIPAGYDFTDVSGRVARVRGVETVSGERGPGQGE